MHDTRGLAVRWFDELWNQGRRETIDELLAPDAVIHDGDCHTVGAAQFHPFFDRIHSVFSDLKFGIHTVIVEGNMVCVRWSFAAKHTCDGLGVPASGKSISATGMSLLRVVDGKLVEGWQNWDMLGLMQQIQGCEPAATYIAAAGI